MKTRHFLTAAVATTAFGFAGVASGQEFTWTGASDNDWRNNANWLEDGNPTANYPNHEDHEAIITNAGISPELDLQPGSVDVGKLEIQAGGTLTIVNSGTFGNKLLVTDTGTLNGDIDVQPAGTLLMLDDAYVDVKGPVLIQAGTSTRGVIRLEDDLAQFDVHGKLTMEDGRMDPALLQIGTVTDGGVVKLMSEQTHEISGLVDLINADSRLEVELSSYAAVNEVIFDAHSSTIGQVRGFDNDAKLIIDDPGSGNALRFTNQIEVRGGMIVGPPSSSPVGTVEFMNKRVDADGQAWNQVSTGIVRATAGQELTLATGLTIMDASHHNGETYRPSWESVGANAVLRFSNTAGTCGVDNLVGTFVLDNGKLCLNIEETEELHTAGNLELFGSWSVSSPFFEDEVGPILIYECNEVQFALDDDC